MHVAVDAMGGDHAPRVVVEGAIEAARISGVGVTLVGAEAQVRDALALIPGSSSLDIRVVPATEVVDMGEAPAQALRRKRSSSIRVAADLVAAGEAGALFSAGNTGATVLAARGALGMLAGAERPALAASVPTRTGRAVLLDVGANADCRPGHLVTFAVMGLVYARVGLGIAHPRVGLLSIGEEASKGNELVRETHARLRGAALPFIGNVEARDLYAGDADVVVCDGFTGNVAIKVSEAMVELIEALLRGDAAAGEGHAAGALLAPEAFESFRRRVDASEYGGAPLLGVAGPCIVGHGRSSARAICQAIVMAHQFAADGLVPRIEAELGGGTRTHHVIAFLFPGQGSQKVGMGRAFADAFPEARAAMAEADAALGDDLSGLCFNGPEDRLVLTENTQPAILAVSIAMCRVLQARGVVPAFVAGHSLGEYSAHVAAGTISFADALRTVRRRGRYMQEAVPVGEGAMAAILGLDAAKVMLACEEAADGDVVSAANLNAPGQVVIAGSKAAVARAIDRAKALGAKRAIPLPVSAPFHCALMKPAEDRLAPDLRALAVSSPRVPVIANVDGEPRTDGPAAIEALVRQVSSPVQWERVMQRLASEGVRKYVEVGPGAVLTGLGRKIVKDATFVSLEEPADLDAAVAALQA